MKHSIKNIIQQRIATMRTIGALLFFSCTLPLIAFSQYSNPAPVNLLTAGNFRALSGTAVTNGAASTITGDVGGTSVTNNGVITGSIFTAGGIVTTALGDLAAVITDVSARTADEALGVELGGLTLGRGIYSSGTFGINGTLTLNGTASDIFIFKAGTTLITGATCNVVLSGGAVWSNVFWQLGSSATIDGTFKGVILANTAITQNTGSIEGRTLARDGGVTLTGTSTLPVELSSFTATVHGTVTQLLWATATEVNNYGFEIQRSVISTQQSDADSRMLNAESTVWINVGFVEGNGTSNNTHEYSYIDRSLSAGKYSFRLKQIDRDGRFEYSHSVEVLISQVPQSSTLMQNFPNPFNPTTVISYQLSAPGHTSLVIVDAVGREVAELVNDVKEAGSYSVQYDATHHASGIYFARLTSGGTTQMKKLMLVK